MQHTPTEVFGWGADRSPADRPGHPKEKQPPGPTGNPHWIEPEPQMSGTVVVRDPRRPVTPVYGTTIPPRGLSGMLRRFAYTIPTYKARRWMLLLLADRVDVIEHNPSRLAGLLGGAALLTFGVVAYQRLARD
jgi:hypothetical protein